MSKEREAFEQPLVGLNCGSGQRRFETIPGQIGWINVDCQADESRQPDLTLNLKYSWPWEDACVDFVVFHHCWEHEGCGEAEHFQVESLRVLKPGGSLIITVPDMRALAQAWLLGKLDTQIYMTNVYGAFMGSEYDRHKWGFDEQALIKELRKHPWSDVRLFNWRAIPGVSIVKDWWILGVEAIR